ncbi:hypothetical protein ACIQ9E_26815 [Streptomyces sp. NPDC094448]|uniref:hypothetical protein n=1 Tax=Streptomyces sp. NPDC094448 TaxID=3366063 RepID=UPI003819981C
MRVIFLSLIAGVAAVGAGIPLAVAAEPTVSESVAAEIPHAVEDFSYPGAAQILATQSIKLKKGDGNITLVECGTALAQIKVHSVEDGAVGRKGAYCFQVRGAAGHLTLELSRVFALETTEHAISADLTVNGATKTVEVAKGGWKSVGEGIEGGLRSVLVELRVTG